MASTSLLPHVGAGQAPITPQMGGGGNVSLLPEVPARIDAQLGGKPVKMKKIRKSKSVKVQRGGFTFTEDEQKFYELIQKMTISNNEKITSVNMKKKEHYIFFIEFIKNKFSKFIENISNSINESKVENIIKIRLVLIKIITTFENFMEQFKRYNNKSDENFKTFKAIFYNPDNEKLIKNGVRILTLINYIDGTNKMTKTYGNRLIKITEEYENYVPNEEDEDKNSGRYKSYRNIIREESKKIIPPPAPLPTSSKPATTAVATPTTATAPSTKSSAPPATAPTTATTTTTTAPLPATEEDKNKVCYEELKKKLNMDSPNFESTIREIMKSIPVDQMSAIIRDPQYKNIRSLISQMITMKIDQFKTDLMAARGVSRETVTVGPSGETVAVGPSGETVAIGPSGETVAVGPSGETVAVGPSGETVAIGPSGETVATSGTKEITSGEKDGTIPKTTTGATGTTGTTTETTTGTTGTTSPITYGGKYGNLFETQKSLLCGLHSLNNLFIEERRKNEIETFTKEGLDNICNELKGKEPNTDYGCDNPFGYYEVTVLQKAIDSTNLFIYELSNPVKEEIEKDITKEYAKEKEELVNILLVEINNDKISYDLQDKTEDSIQSSIEQDINVLFGSSEELSSENENYLNLLIRKFNEKILPILKTKDLIDIDNYTEQIKNLLSPDTIGAIIGNGSHYYAIRKINEKEFEIRDSMSNLDSIIEVIKDDDQNVLFNKLEKRLINPINKNFRVIVVKKKPDTKPITNLTTSKAPTTGGAKTRSKRRGIRVKKTKRRSKK